MVPQLTLLALGLASLTSGLAITPRDGGDVPRCGAADPTESQIQAAQALSLLEVDVAAMGSDISIQAATVVVDTYFHVVASSKRESDGYLSTKAIQDQIAVLNKDYGPSGFRFNLRDTTWTVNPTWATGTSMSSSTEMQMKKALRKGSYSALNIYYLKDIGGALGYCYFPAASPSARDRTLDGCSVLSGSAPGGDIRNFNLGKTTTHEVGHWMGLFHTFQGGCSGAGDSVADTPAQQSASSGCPIGRDSCPGGGVDPIHNYMDYSNDACYEEFTKGQQARMHTSWRQYRR